MAKCDDSAADFSARDEGFMRRLYSAICDGGAKIAELAAVYRRRPVTWVGPRRLVVAFCVLATVLAVYAAARYWSNTEDQVNHLLSNYHRSAFAAGPSAKSITTTDEPYSAFGTADQIEQKFQAMQEAIRSQAASVSSIAAYVGVLRRKTEAQEEEISKLTAFAAAHDKRWPRKKARR